MKKWQRALGRLLVMLSFLSAISLILYFNWEQTSKETLEGEKMPDIQGEAWNQTEIYWASDDGRAKLLYFFEPQCAQCLEQLDLLNELHRKGSFEHVDFVAVTTEREDILHRLYNTHGWMIQTVIDDGVWQETFRPKQIPTLIVINKQGKIIRYIEKRIHSENISLVLKSIS